MKHLYGEILTTQIKSQKQHRKLLNPNVQQKIQREIRKPVSMGKTGQFNHNQ